MRIALCEQGSGEARRRCEIAAGVRGRGGVRGRFAPERLTIKLRYSPSIWKQAAPQNSISNSILGIFSFSAKAVEACGDHVPSQRVPNSEAPFYAISHMYGRYTKPPSWRNLAKRPTLQRGSRDAAECADAGCTGATGTRGYGGCAGAAVLGCGRGVPLKTAVESSPWTERGAPKSALTHQKQTPFSSLEKKFKQRVAPCGARARVQVGIRTMVEPVWIHTPSLAPVSLPFTMLGPLPCAHLAQNPPSRCDPNAVFYPDLRHREVPVGPEHLLTADAPAASRT